MEPTWAWPNFKPEEVLSPSGLIEFNRSGLLLVSPLLLNKLEQLRSRVGPMLINHGPHQRRCYRDPLENASVGGEPHSLHLQGLAADVTVPGMTLYQLSEVAIDLGFKGIGMYLSANFVHMDLRYNMRGNITRWERA